MRRGLLLAALLLSGQAPAPQTPPKLPPGYEAYLPAERAAAGIGALPAAGSAGERLDRARFDATRALAGTPRWALATTDAGRGVLHGFACAAGVELSADNAPALVKLLTRLRTDMINVTRAGAAGAPPQPFVASPSAPVCVPSQSLKPEYPSLQAAWGWGLGLILSEALPARNVALMARGRAFGDSALVCGTSAASAVTAGRKAGAALVATLHADPAFAADLAAAKREIAAARGPAPTGCAAEAETLATPIP